MGEFKIGEKVRYHVGGKFGVEVEPWTELAKLVLNKVYTVSDVSGKYISVEKNKVGYHMREEHFRRKK